MKNSIAIVLGLVVAVVAGQAEYDEYLANVEFCHSLGSRNDCRQDKPTRKLCRWKKKRCQIRRTPKICELECRWCKSEDDCGNQIGCGWVSYFDDDDEDDDDHRRRLGEDDHDDDDGECYSCSRECEGCVDEEACATNSECFWNGNGCAEADDEQIYLNQLEICSGRDSEESCEEHSRACKWRRGRCSPREGKPDNCNFDCDECDDKDSCANSFHGVCHFDEKEDECLSCGKHCGGCPDEETCLASGSKKKCVWNGESCRKENKIEAYLRLHDLCSNITDGAECDDTTGCKPRGDECTVNMRAPKTCDTKCNRCSFEDECTSSPIGCLWDINDEKCEDEEDFDDDDSDDEDSDDDDSDSDDDE